MTVNGDKHASLGFHPCFNAMPSLHSTDQALVSLRAEDSSAIIRPVQIDQEPSTVDRKCHYRFHPCYHDLFYLQLNKNVQARSADTNEQVTDPHGLPAPLVSSGTTVGVCSSPNKQLTEFQSGNAKIVNS